MLLDMSVPTIVTTTGVIGSLLGGGGGGGDGFGVSGKLLVSVGVIDFEVVAAIVTVGKVSVLLFTVDFDEL